MEGPSHSGPGGVSSSNGMSRAERFEDEKRRIIDSCFGKKDEDGSLLESYITHIRVIEDAMFPASPPPPNANPASKKPRLIIVAVRKSGRVRMHKARENPNGTFSIGKTWMLDELNSVRSFSGAIPRSAEEEQQKQWAGGAGFIVTMGKPYYWQANTQKEKQFFIASLVKIYTKYTGGKTPQLDGFDQREMDQLLGAPGRSLPPSQTQSPSGTLTSGPIPPFAQAPNRPPPPLQTHSPSGPSPSGPLPPFAQIPSRPPPPLQTQSPSGPSPSGPLPPFAQVPNRPPPSGPLPSFATNRPPPRRDPSREPGLRNQPSRDALQRPTAQMSPAVGAPSFNSPTARPQMRVRREESPSETFDPTGTGTQQSQASNLRRLAGTNQSQESFAKSEDTVSLPPRSRGGLNGTPNAPGRFRDRSVTPTLQRAITPDDAFSGSRDALDDMPPVPAPLTIPPERRRPPIPNIGDSRPHEQSLDESIIPAPLSSPGMRREAREDLRPPTRSSERNQPRQRDSDTTGSLISPNEVQPPQSISDSLKRGEVSASPLSAQVTATSQPTISSPLAQTTTETEPEEETRPGLGPMIKKKKSILVEIPQEPPAEVEEETRPGLGPMIKNKSPVEMPEEPPAEPEEDERPGLGPMIKKKKSRPEIANTFLRAAKTANAFSTFKPRAGGAAERLREAAAKAQEKEGPDGITSVVPAPSLVAVRAAINTNSNASTPTETPIETTSTPKESIASTQKESEKLPEVNGIVPPRSEQPTSVEEKAPQDTTSAEKSKTREIKRPKPSSETMQKELASLGIDPSILGGKGNDLVAAWDEFGWVGDGVHTKNIDQMKEEIERELNRVQAGGWLSRLEEEDERVEAIKAGLDKCIDECDELDGLLTLYLVEISTLNEDIAFIEAQSQGLQVQAANQKLLQAELKSLLDTISISSSQLESLSQASLESPRGLEQIETSLVVLYKAMLTIDPSLSLSGPRGSEDGSLIGRPGGIGNSEIGSMRVLQEKKDVYRHETATFLRRLRPFLQVKFAAAIDETRKALERERGSNLARAGKVKLDPRNHDLARELLWRYSPLMLFSREVDRPEWEELMKIYETVSRPLYQDEFRDAVFAWKRIAKKAAGDEGDLLFTSQIEKQAEGIATTARKLTVKRSQTLAKSLRSPIGDNSSKTSVDRIASDGRLQPYEVFAGVLEEMIPIISMEQNFIVEFFHVTSLEQYDFPEVVAAASPDDRRGVDLRRPRVMEPNRELARHVVQSMEEVYSFFPGDLQALVDWSLQADPLQGVGVIAAIERKLVEFEESSQEFLARTLQKQHIRLVGLFTKFLDEQIRAIEETKVKIKKRKGVISFVRIFPSFSLALETMLISADDLEIRETVNNAYTRINKAMFESLKVIAREIPSAQTTGADPEDKEALNYQILLIENMNHYLEEVDARSNPILEDWKHNAAQEMEEHMSLYLGAVIRRPLGKLLDFIESTESLMLSRQPGELASKISGMPSHSKITFQKVLAGYDSKEIKRGIETLKKRVEKHFGDADDPGLSRSLVSKVLQNCERYYEQVEDRILTISRDVYDGDVIAEWTRADVSAAFRSQR